MDILFIMRRICICTKARRGQGGAHADGENEDAVEEEVAPPPTFEQIPTQTSTPAAAKGRGRGARKRDMAEEPVGIYAFFVSLIL